MGSKQLQKWKNLNDFISENHRKLVFPHPIAIGQQVAVPVDVQAWRCWSLRLSILESYWNTNYR